MAKEYIYSLPPPAIRLAEEQTSDDLDLLVEFDELIGIFREISILMCHGSG